MVWIPLEVVCKVEYSTIIYSTDSIGLHKNTTLFLKKMYVRMFLLFKIFTRSAYLQRLYFANLDIYLSLNYSLPPTKVTGPEKVRTRHRNHHLFF